MALTEREKTQALQLSELGYSTEEIIRHIGASRAGRTSAVSVEEKQRNETLREAVNRKPFIQRAGEFVTSPEAIDALGSAAARGPLGSLITGQSRETLEDPEFGVEAPSRKAVGGALLQTGAAIGDVALAPVSLPAQIVAGTGAGYLYDVGNNLVKDRSTLTPGAATIFGAAVPITLKGAGMGLSQLGDLAGTGFGAARRAGQPVVDDVVEQTEPAARGIAEDVSDSAIGQQAREIGQAPARIIRRLDERATTLRDRAEYRASAPEVSQRAIDQGLDLGTVKRVDTMSEVERDATARMVRIAEEGSDEIPPTIIPGEYKAQQLETVVTRRREIGQRIGELSDALPNQTVEMGPTHRNLVRVLNENGVFYRNGELDFENKSLTEPQQNAIRNLYRIATQDQTLSPKQIHQFDQQFSALQRESRFVDQVEDVYFTYRANDGSMVTQPAHEIFRDVYRQTLSNLDQEGAIRAANREYAILRNLQDAAEGSIARAAKNDGITLDPAQSAAVNMRRIFGSAVSTPEYQQIAKELDEVSRLYDYDGPNAENLYSFYLRDIKPLYPETVPLASFERGVTEGIRGFFGNVADLARTTEKDKQRALKELLGVSEETPLPQAPAATMPEKLRDVIELNSKDVLEKKGIVQTIRDGLSDQKGAINPRRPELTRQGVSLDKYNRIRGEALDAMEEFVDMRKSSDIIDPEDITRINANKNVILDELGMKEMKDEDVIELFTDILDDKGRVSFNPSATTKTTDLLEEARKYDSAEEFVKAQGTPVYHGTNQDFVVFGDGQSGLSATKMGSAENNYFFTDNLEEGWAYARNADKTLIPNENQFNQKVEQMYQDYIKAENVARRSGKNSDWDKAQKLLEEYETFYFDTTRDAKPTNAKVLEAYLEYKKPYTHNVDGTITSGEVQEIVARAKKDGYDAVILKNVSDNPEGTIDFRSNHTIVFDPSKIKTRTQLEDIWKQANGVDQQ